MKNTLALTALCAVLASASVVNAKEAPVGQLGSVTGNVSIGGSNFINKATTGTPLYAGNTVLVASNAQATIVMADGCTIQLAPAQHLRVVPGLKCNQLQASVKQLFSPYQVAQAPVPGSTPVPAPMPAEAILAGSQAAPLLPALGFAPALGIGAGVLGLGRAVSRSGTSGS
jgi:hypothetical protein